MLRKAVLLLSVSATTVLGTPSVSVDHSLPCQIYPISTFTAGEKLQFQSAPPPFACTRCRLTRLTD